MAKHDPDLSRIFAALADPTRRAMVAALGQGPQPLGVLAAPTGLRLPTVMKHLAQLEEAGLVTTAKVGRLRLCRLAPETLASIDSWLCQQRSLWSGHADRLEDYALSLMKETRDDPRA
jgi:DNA-binding transcriptional ArsR family regulator